MTEIMIEINEIFESISGEAGGFPQGSWCTFIRLQGCNLQCTWCDTERAQAFGKGRQIAVHEVAQEVTTKKVIITGGEPLCQLAPLFALVSSLHRMGKEVQIETNGSIRIPRLPRLLSKGAESPVLHWVADVKPPSSGMCGCNLVRSQAEISPATLFLKYVIADQEDLDFALRHIEFARAEGETGPFLLSPLNGDRCRFADLIEDLLDKKPRMGDSLMDSLIFSLQIHKIANLP